MKKLTLWLWLLLSVMVAGCGGGGGGGGAASGGVGVFLTDDLSTNYSAVWVTLFKVELVKQDGGRVTVFDDASGKVFNLRALNDGSPRFAFLGKESIPEGLYTGIRFTLDRDVHLIPSGSSNANLRTFDDSYNHPSNPSQSVLTITFGTAKSLSGTVNDLVCDFVLSEWEDNGSKVRNCTVREGGHGGLGDSDRHEHDRWEGTVTKLEGTAPDFTFVMDLRSKNAVTVTVSSETSIFNGDGSPNPQLANGKKVEVRGKFDPATRNIFATAIKIKRSDDNGSEDPHEVKGLVKDVNADAGTFDVRLGEAEGFIPVADFVHVTTSTGTRFFSHGGVLLSKEQMFAILLGGAKRVEAEGVWNADTNTLAAVKVKIEDEDDDHEAEAKGAPSALDVAAGTFNITLVEWEGFSSSTGSVIGVVTNGSTKFRNADGQEVTKEAFFELLAAAAAVKVEGIYANGVITAKYARIRASGGGGGGGGGGQAEVRGTVQNVNSGEKSFDLVLIEWAGFDGSANMVIHITFTDAATFRDEEGETINLETFFSKLHTGQMVEAEGTWTSATTTLVARKAKLEDD